MLPKRAEMVMSSSSLLFQLQNDRMRPPVLGYELPSTQVRTWRTWYWERPPMFLCSVSCGHVIVRSYDRVIMWSCDCVIMCSCDCAIVWSCGHVIVWSCGHVIVVWLCDDVIIWSYGHVIVWSCGHVIVWSCGHVIVVWLCDHVIMWSYGHMVIWSCNRVIMWHAGRGAGAGVGAAPGDPHVLHRAGEELQPGAGAGPPDRHPTAQRHPADAPLHRQLLRRHLPGGGRAVQRIAPPVHTWGRTSSAENSPPSTHLGEDEQCRE